MSPTKRELDDIELTERLSRGWEEVYYGEEWPTDEEAQWDAYQQEIKESDE